MFWSVYILAAKILLLHDLLLNSCWYNLYILHTFSTHNVLPNVLNKTRKQDRRFNYYYIGNHFSTRTSSLLCNKLYSSVKKKNNRNKRFSKCLTGNFDVINVKLHFKYLQKTPVKGVKVKDYSLWIATNK